MSTVVLEGVESGARLFGSHDLCWERPWRACRMPERGTTGTFNRKRALHTAPDGGFASRVCATPPEYGILAGLKPYCCGLSFG